MDGVQIGRIVHYVEEGGTHTAAIIIGPQVGEGICNLKLFRDDSMDGCKDVAKVAYSKESKPRTWHWPERV